MGIVLAFGWIEREYGLVALGAGKTAGVQADALDGTAVSVFKVGHGGDGAFY